MLSLLLSSLPWPSTALVAEEERCLLMEFLSLSVSVSISLSLSNLATQSDDALECDSHSPSVMSDFCFVMVCTCTLHAQMRSLEPSGLWFGRRASTNHAWPAEGGGGDATEAQM